MRQRTRVVTALGGLVISLAALAGLLVTGSQAAEQQTVEIVYSGQSFTPNPASATHRAFVRFTNNSGLQLRVRSTGGACGFDVTVDGFSSSKPLGPLARGGRCDYRGTTIVGSAAGVITIANPPPGPSPTPRPSVSPTPSVAPSVAPSLSPSVSVTPSVSPSASASPVVTESPLPEPTFTTSPEPLPSSSPAPAPSSTAVAILDLRDQGRRSAGLPGALAAVAVAAVIGAVARVLSAEAG